MKKLILSMNITLDGYLSGPDGELDWHFESWNGEMNERLAYELSKADTILLGRNTYQQMAGYWSNKATEFLCPRDDIAIAVMMNRYRKIIFSKTLKEAKWNNSILIKEKLEEGIIQLKQDYKTSNKNIIVFGSGQLVHSLLQKNLIDEYLLWVHPVILGKGKMLFDELGDSIQLKLLNAKTFQSGVVLLRYKIGIAKSLDL